MSAQIDKNLIQSMEACSIKKCSPIRCENEHINKLKAMNYTIKVLRIKKRMQQLLIVLLLGVFSQVPAQTDVITIGGPGSIAIHGDNLYVFRRDASKIVKIDLTGSTPVAVDVITGLSAHPFSEIKVYNDELYFIHKCTVSTSYKCVKKISLVEDNPSLVTVFEGDATISALDIFGGKLYLAYLFGGDVTVVDLTENPVATSSISTQSGSTFGYHMLATETNLFIQRSNGGVYFFDLTMSPPTMNYINLNPSGGGVFFNNKLHLPIIDTGIIYKFDFTTTPASYTTVVSGLNRPWSLALYNDELYIAEYGANKISKISLAVLSVDTQKRTPKLLYPNPSSNYLQIAGLTTKQTFTIYNVLGMQVQKGIVFPGKKIDITGLSMGIYSIQFGNTYGLQFIKK